MDSASRRRCGHANALATAKGRWQGVADRTRPALRLLGPDRLLADDVPELRASAFPVEVDGKTVAEMDQQFGAGKSIAFNALPAPFQKTVSGRNGTFRQWKKTDGPTTTTVYAEIKDGKIGDSYINQKWGE